MSKRTLALSEQLEQLVLGAVLHGAVPFEIVQREELSRTGQYIHEAIDRLRKSTKAPYDHNAVCAMAVEVLGAEADDVRPYLKRLAVASAGKGVGEIIRALRDRQVLIDVVNAASEQLEKCTLDKNSLLQCFDIQKIDSIVPLSQLVGDTIPDPPSGVEIKSLPVLSKATGGMFGMWAIAGEPAVGKSALGLQIALHVCQVMPVLYYDFENGLRSMLHRLGSALGGPEKMKKALTKFYLRESIKFLDTDLAQFEPPALLVIDSVQKLPTSVEFRRTSLDKWVHKLEMLKKRGYDVLLLSEKGREQYGQANMNGFKETGEIEYSAELGVQLLTGEDRNHVEVHIVKNRHRITTGHVSTLVRKSAGWFTEEEAEQRDNEQSDM